MTETLQPIRTRGESFAADIPADLVEADRVLTSYGLWATSRRGGSGPGTLDRQYIREADRAESLEAYQRRRQYVPRDVALGAREAMDAQRALARVADRERVVLAILYVPRRIPVAVQLRMLRIPPALSQQRHLAGLRMFDTLHRLVREAGARRWNI